MNIKTGEDLQEILRMLTNPSKMSAVEYAQILKRATFLMQNVRAKENLNDCNIQTPDNDNSM